MKYGSVCSGVEAASLAWMPLGWECAFVSEIEPFPCAVLQKRLGASAPINEWDENEAATPQERAVRRAWNKSNRRLKRKGVIPNEGDFTKIGDKYAGKIDLLVGGTPCFVAGTMVLTPSGYRPIESLSVGDSVINADGEVDVVSATGHKEANVGSLKIYGRVPIVCTPNHPLMSIRTKRDNCRKSPSYGNIILDGETTFTPASESVGLDAVRLFHPATDYFVPFNDTGLSVENVMRLAGWYVGDGYIRRYRGKNKKQVILALVRNSKIDRFKQMFSAMPFNYSVSKDGKVIISNTKLADWLVSNFGEHANGKRIPYWVYCSSLNVEFIRCYEFADGSFDSVRGRWRVSSISKALAYGYADLKRSASVTLHVPPQKCVIEGRIVNPSPYWTVAHKVKNAHIRAVGANRVSSKIRSFNNDGRVATVYNITVARKHTYVVEGICVHNCQDLSVAGKQAGFNGARSSLAIDFVRLAYLSKCKWFVWENVPGIFSSNGGRDFARLLSLFTGTEVGVPKQGWSTAGFVCNARRDRFGVAWRVLDAQYTRVSGFPFAIPQRRRRVFVVGYFGDWTHAASVLLEPEVQRWNTPARIKTREILAGNAGKSSAVAEGQFRCYQTDRSAGHRTDVSCTLDVKCKDGSCRNQAGMSIVASIGNGQTDTLEHPNVECSNTLSCMHDHEAIVSYDCYNQQDCGSVAKTLQTEHHGTNLNVIAEHKALSLAGGQKGELGYIGDDVSQTLSRNNGGFHYLAECGAFFGRVGADAGSVGYADQCCPTQRASMEPYVLCVDTKQKSVSQLDDCSETLIATEYKEPKAVVCYNPDDPQTVRCYSEDGVMPTLSANNNGGQNRQSVLCTQKQDTKSVVCYENHSNDNRVTESGNLSPTLTSRAGTGGNNLPLISSVEAFPIDLQNATRSPEKHDAVNRQSTGCGDADDPSPTLSTAHHHAVALCTKGNGDAFLSDVHTSLSASGGGQAGQGYPACVDPHAVTIAENIIGRKVENGGNGVGAQSELAYTQNATGVMGVGFSGTVRRLLPVECERLMGFPDGWTRIPWRGKPEEDCPDSPRYKACGNSFCVNVVRWIGERIEYVERLHCDEKN